MKKIFTKKNIIISIAIIIYAAVLPLALHFSGAFKKEAATMPDLKQLTGYEPDYKMMTDDEKCALLESIGFDIQAFEDGGFNFSLNEIRVYTYGNDPSKIAFFRVITQEDEKADNEYTYLYITLTVYMPGAESAINPFIRNYERREINGKPVGVYEPSDDFGMSHPQARYCDAQTGCVYYIEPVLSFNDTATEFLKILVSL